MKLRSWKVLFAVLCLPACSLDFDDPAASGGAAGAGAIGSDGSAGGQVGGATGKDAGGTGSGGGSGSGGISGTGGGVGGSAGAGATGGSADGGVGASGSGGTGSSGGTGGTGGSVGGSGGVGGVGGTGGGVGGTGGGAGGSGGSGGVGGSGGTGGAQSCSNGTDSCPKGYYCLSASCAAGTCVPATGTGSSKQPVCGCDGITYWNDTLLPAGTAARSQTECSSTATACFTTAGCPAKTWCNLRMPNDQCQSLTTGSCWGLPQICGGPPVAENCSAKCDSECAQIKAGERYYVGIGACN